MSLVNHAWFSTRQRLFNLEKWLFGCLAVYLEIWCGFLDPPFILFEESPYGEHVLEIFVFVCISL